MTSSATLRHLRIAPRKVRAVADLVRGKRVGEALSLLRFTAKAAARPVSKLLRSAVANAVQTGKDVDVDLLYVQTIKVDQGRTLRRFMPRAQGRATRINKKSSHVEVMLSDKRR